jgi:hypothetical protein
MDAFVSLSLTSRPLLEKNENDCASRNGRRFRMQGFGSHRHLLMKKPQPSEAWKYVRVYLHLKLQSPP